MIVECTAGEDRAVAGRINGLWRNRQMAIMGTKKQASSVLPAKLSEQEIQDEIVRQGLGITAQLRQEIAHWRDRAEDAEAELRVKEHEFNGKIQAARLDNDSLRKQLSDVGAKYEHYIKTALELKTTTNNLELFYTTELQRIAEHTTRVADDAHNSITSFVKGSVNALRQYIDDLHHKTEHTEYRPLDYVAKPESLPDIPDIPQFLTKPKVTVGDEP